MDKSIRDEDIEFVPFSWKDFTKKLDWEKFSETIGSILGGEVKTKTIAMKPLHVNAEIQRRQKSLPKHQLRTKKIVQRRFNISMPKLKRYNRNR